MRRPPILLVAAVLLAACGDDASTTGACGPILREELDPNSGLHVLPTATDVEYVSDPPTSGPHQPGPPLEPVQDQPLSRPLQVGVLEAGRILIQYDADNIAPTDVERLETLSDEHVVVAPGTDLSDPIVVTAWTAKRTCEALDITALAEFVEARVGKAPGSDG